MSKRYGSALLYPCLFDTRDLRHFHLSSTIRPYLIEKNFSVLK